MESCSSENLATKREKSQPSLRPHHDSRHYCMRIKSPALFNRRSWWRRRALGLETKRTWVSIPLFKSETKITSSSIEDLRHHHHMRFLLFSPFLVYGWLISNHTFDIDGNFLKKKVKQNTKYHLKKKTSLPCNWSGLGQLFTHNNFWKRQQNSINDRQKRVIKTCWFLQFFKLDWQWF
jgi:hypothetical protein